jgi:hypothetical protein
MSYVLFWCQSKDSSLSKSKEINLNFNWYEHQSVKNAMNYQNL